jgi:hypothetical protein
MKRADPRIAERNRQIVELYTDPVNPLPPSAIAVRFGIGLATVRHILSTAKVRAPEDGRSRFRGKRNNLNLKHARPITSLHQQIGVKLDSYRSFTLRQTVDNMAVELGIANKRLRAMELGAYDPTLTELMKFAKLLGVTLQELVTETDRVGRFDGGKRQEMVVG